MRKKFTIIAAHIIISILVPTLANAQQFQWVKGGGTAETTSSGYMNEATYFMTTDPNGNMYALSIVGDDPIYADTFYRSQGAYGAPQNILVTSYTRSGQMRWAKLIASTSGNCTPFGIAADSSGHIYVAGFMPPSGGTLHIGYDTMLTGAGNDYLYNGLIQFDTSGHFNWVKYVGNNTIATLAGTLSFGSALTIDGANNIHFINNMKSGVPITPDDISQYGEYDLTYNSGGTLLSAKRLNMDSVWFVTAVTIDPVTNKLFACGSRNTTLPVGCIAAFDTNRNVIWMDTMGNHACGAGNVIYDRMGHLYFNGASNYNSFSFNGISGPSGNTSDILKTDTDGHPIWLQTNQICCNGTNAYNPNTLTLLPNNLIASAGFFGTTITDGIHSITVTGSGNNPFLSIVDTSGVPLSLLELYGDGYYDWSTSITSDRIGNVYIGGQVADSIYATNPSGSIPAYYTVGGNTDFFVMRYGIDSDCTAMPVANYTNTGADTAHARNFTYTGTTEGVDSVVWNFGDTSATTQGMTATHTYDTGVFEACVTVYTSCGMDMHCSRIEVVPPTGINTVTAGNVQVYPNPAKDELIITNAPQGSKATVLNILGQQIFTNAIGSSKQTIDVSNLSNGSYLLQITKNDGSRFVQKFVIAR